MDIDRPSEKETLDFFDEILKAKPDAKNREHAAFILETTSREMAGKTPSEWKKNPDRRPILNFFYIIRALYANADNVPHFYDLVDSALWLDAATQKEIWQRYNERN